MTSQEFSTNGHVYVERLIDAQTIQTVSHYLENKITREDWRPEVGKTEAGTTDATALFVYADPLVEVLLSATLHAVEEATGLTLLPTYSYARVYQAGEQLPKHVDRAACEISVTINIASIGGISPLLVQYKDGQPRELLLNPGDALVYKGCEVEHWRESFSLGQTTVQMMLHYVDANGPYKGHIFDGRGKLGPNKLGVRYANRHR